MKRAEAEAALSRVIKSSGLGRDAQTIWEDWPSLRTVALKLCWFLSPYIEADGGNLLERAIQTAIGAFHADEGVGRDKARAFLHQVADCATTLGSLQIAVKNRAGDWCLWQYDEPLMARMELSGSQAVQIRRCREPEASGQIALRLMSSVCTIRDLRLAGIGLSRETP